MLLLTASSRRAPRMAWEPDSDDPTSAGPVADFNSSQPLPQPGPHHTDLDAAVLCGTTIDGSQLGPLSMRRSPGHHPAPPPAPSPLQQQFSGPATKPHATFYRHDNAAFDTGAAHNVDGSCGDGGGGGDLQLSVMRTSPSPSASTSRVSILLRNDPAAAGQGQEVHAPGSGSGGMSVLTASDAAPSSAPQLPYTGGALPYAAARPLLRSSDGAASNGGGGCAGPRKNAPLQRHTFPISAAAVAAAATALAAAAAAAGGGGPLARPGEEEGNPVLPTPPLSLRSSFAASFASSLSTATDFAVARVASAGELDLIPAQDPEPLGPRRTIDGAADADTTAAAAVVRAASWVSARHVHSGDVSGTGVVCSATDAVTGSSSSATSSCSKTGSNSGQASSGKPGRSWRSGDPEATCSSRGEDADVSGGGGVGGGGPFAAGAASLPSTSSSSPSPAPTGCDAGEDAFSTGPKRVQLSISFLPPSSLPGLHAGNAAVTAGGEVPLLLTSHALEEEGSAAPRAAYAVPHAGAGVAPQPQAARSPEAHIRTAEATAINMPSGGSARLSRGASAASAAALTLPAAAAAAAVPAPGDGVLVVAEGDDADDDLEGVDVIASIAVAVPGDEAALLAGQQRERDAVAGDAAAAVAGAGAAGGGDGDDGAASGALPPEVRRKLSGHMGRQRTKSIRSWKDLSHSMAGHPPGYWLLSTMLLLTVMVGAFLFMAGQYEFVRPIDLAAATQGANSQTLATGLADDPLSTYSWGPASLSSWLAFWRSPASRTFTFDYLRLWGGRYGPDLAAGQWWRWVTSLLLHQSSMHLASNTALFLVLSAYLESLFGFWRVLPVWVVAGVAGNMVSAFFESPCMLVVGSSGAVFGLLGAYVADAVLNFESIPLLWLRLAGMAAVAALLIALQVTGHTSGNGRGSSTSHASHIGGFLAGALLSVLLMPDFKAKRCSKVTELLRKLGVGTHLLPEPTSPGGRQLYSFWQRHKALRYGMYGVVVVVLLLMLVALPAALYTRTFSRMVCG